MGVSEKKKERGGERGRREIGRGVELKERKKSLLTISQTRANEDVSL